MLRPFGNRVLAIEPPVTDRPSGLVVPSGADVERCVRAVVFAVPVEPEESAAPWDRSPPMLALEVGEIIYFGAYARVGDHYVVNRSDIIAVDDGK